MNILFLESDPAHAEAFYEKYAGAVGVETALEAIIELRNAHYDVVFLDHVLGVDLARTDSGMEVARWMVAHRPEVKLIFVHSEDSIAAVAMTTALLGAGYRVERRPYSRGLPRLRT